MPLVLYAWISGTAAKIAAAGKKAAAKPSASKSGAVKSGAASAIKSAAKKAVTAAKNTVSSSSQTSKGTSKQNVSGGVKTTGTKLLNAGLSSVKSGGSTGSRSPAKTDWLSKGNAALGDGVLRGISQAVTDIWNQSMSASPIGKLFQEPGKKSGPGIGNTVMEITERVIKEQEQRKEQERIWESRYELRYGEDGEEMKQLTGINNSVNFNTQLNAGESPIDLINAMNKWALTTGVEGVEGAGKMMKIYNNYLIAASRLENSSKVGNRTLDMIKAIEIGDDGRLIDGIYIKNHQANDTGITVGYGQNIKSEKQMYYVKEYNITDFTENGKVDIITATYLLVEHVDKDYKVIADSLPGLNQNQLEALVYMRYLMGNVIPEAEEIKARNYQIERGELKEIFINHLSQNGNYESNKNGWEKRLERALDLYYTSN